MSVCMKKGGEGGKGRLEERGSVMSKRPPVYFVGQAIEHGYWETILNTTETSRANPEPCLQHPKQV